MANFYKIDVPYAAKKTELHQCLGVKLVERRVLTCLVGASGVAVDESEAKAQADADPASGVDLVAPDQPAELSTESLCLAL